MICDKQTNQYQIWNESRKGLCICNANHLCIYSKNCFLFETYQQIKESYYIEHILYQYLIKHNKKYWIDQQIHAHQTNTSIYIIRPFNIMIEDRILCSHISLCKKKIIITSIYYQYNPWKHECFHFIVKSCKIVDQKIYENHHFESSLMIILYLDHDLPSIDLIIEYVHLEKTYTYKLMIEQFPMIEHTLSAMTLCKDDFYLLPRYIDYYIQFGVNLFCIYYNGILTDNIIQYIKDENKYPVPIYLIEWNYAYWWKYQDNTKQHHAQTMAINDSLHILKNYGKYTLYNDLDEYIVFDIGKTFQEYSKPFPYIDIFIYKNQFCTMGTELISYCNFHKQFDLSVIIKGNYWNSKREKNIIRLNSFDVFGVHGFFPLFHLIPIQEKVSGTFYHIVNFVEKNRIHYMTEWIIDKL